MPSRMRRESPQMSRARPFIILAAIFALGAAASYGLARGGEPSSAWLWSWAL